MATRREFKWIWRWRPVWALGKLRPGTRLRTCRAGVLNVETEHCKQNQRLAYELCEFHYFSYLFSCALVAGALHILCTKLFMATCIAGSLQASSKKTMWSKVLDHIHSVTVKNKKEARTVCHLLVGANRSDQN